jgi:hypothetical protein
MRNYLSVLAVGALSVSVSCSPKKELFTAAELESLKALTDQVSQERLMQDMSRLTVAHLTDEKYDCTPFEGSETYRPLCHLSRNKSGDMMETELKALGLQVRRDVMTKGLVTTSNVIADLPGTTHPEEVVLVGAHFDAYWAGADDNSTGVAAVLELARVLSQYKFERTLRFVGFDMEEYGLVGSNRYVGTLTSHEKTVMSVNFDCIGYYDDRPGTQQSMPGLPSPTTGDFLAVIANDVTAERAVEVFELNERLGFMKVTPLISPRDGTFPMGAALMRSDHTPFWLTGHESLFFTDTAVFRNPNYHQPTDTVDTLDPVRFTRAVQVAAAGLGHWAGLQP